ncbi:MAG: hypothetical protein IKF78_10615 [Atopobiaceae bacterium]|nr:hypothetical protein [Atopobiaceae bacterium]
MAVSFVGSVSSLYTTSVLIKDLMGIGNLENACKTYWPALLLIGVVIALVVNRERTLFVDTVADTGIQVETKVGNLFSINASSFVIPTNTFFRTKVDNNYIRYESVQGQFQRKVYGGSTRRLDAAIRKSLKEQGRVGVPASDRIGEVLRYPVGTVAKVDYDGKHYYFLAMNDVNKDGKPTGQSYDNVKKALESLEHAILTFGHCDTLAMPLIGTGHAAIKDASCERVAMEIVDEFVDCREQLARKVVVCVSPRDYVDGRINFKRLAKYIEYRCEFFRG